MEHVRAIDEERGTACTEIEFARIDFAERSQSCRRQERRANTLKGETFPDPSKDDSILKLKKDKAFWTFVQSLPRS